MLRNLCRTLEGLGDKGHLIETLIWDMEEEEKEYDEFDDDMMKLRNSLPRLTELDCYDDCDTGTYLLQYITSFHQLRSVRLKVNQAAEMKNLLAMEGLHDVGLVVLGQRRAGVARVARTIEDSKSGGARQLSLETLKLEGDISQPLVIAWMQQVDAKVITLYFDGDQDIGLILAALSTKVERLSLNCYFNTIQLSASAFDRFSNLRHLTLGRSFDLSANFRTTLPRHTMLDTQFSHHLSPSSLNLT
jgi:hypothetical protein